VSRTVLACNTCFQHHYCMASLQPTAIHIRLTELCIRLPGTHGVMLALIFISYFSQAYKLSDVSTQWPCW
jgi:hypothetical protein